MPHSIGWLKIDIALCTRTRTYGLLSTTIDDLRKMYADCWQTQCIWGSSQSRLHIAKHANGFELSGNPAMRLTADEVQLLLSKIYAVLTDFPKAARLLQQTIDWVANQPQLDRAHTK
jgi:hypothetical protein